MAIRDIPPAKRSEWAAFKERLRDLEALAIKLGISFVACASDQPTANDTRVITCIQAFPEGGVRATREAVILDSIREITLIAFPPSQDIIDNSPKPTEEEIAAVYAKAAGPEPNSLSSGSLDGWRVYFNESLSRNGLTCAVKFLGDLLGADDTGLATLPAPQAPAKSCTCSVERLMVYGCKCGAIAHTNG